MHIWYSGKLCWHFEQTTQFWTKKYVWQKSKIQLLPTYLQWVDSKTIPSLNIANNWLLLAHCQMTGIRIYCLRSDLIIQTLFAVQYHPICTNSPLVMCSPLKSAKRSVLCQTNCSTVRFLICWLSEFWYNCNLTYCHSLVQCYWLSEFWMGNAY